MKVYIVLFFCVISRTYDVKSQQNPPVGHGLELGRHRPSQGHIEVLTEIPTPGRFWEDYAKTRTPVLLRSAAKTFPAFKLWTDGYLKENFGDLEVKLEAKREKDKTPVGQKGVGRDTIRNYLETYRTEDSYVVSQLPDPMARDVNVLSCLSCGTFQERVLEANFWLSSGGTSSLLHRDADNAINCLLNGTKDWMLINPEHEENIPIAEGDRGYGGFAVLDINNVNLLKYHNFQHVPWHYANMTPGDCLFLPYGYWHQVRSYGSKNMAVSVLFSRLKEFNSSGCHKEQYKSRPLSTANMVWTYPGHGPQTLGNSDPFEVRELLSDVAKEISRANQTFDKSILHTMLSEEAGVTDEELVNQVVENIYTSLLNFTHGEITETTINDLTIEQLKVLASYIEQDPANTEEYENVLFSPDEMSETIGKAMDIDHGKLTLPTLIQQHKVAGGSEKVGRDIFFQMDLNHDGVVEQEELSETIEEVLEQFKQTHTIDESYDYYVQEHAKDKKMMRNEQKSHEEL